MSMEKTELEGLSKADLKAKAEELGIKVLARDTAQQITEKILAAVKDAPPVEVRVEEPPKEEKPEEPLKGEPIPAKLQLEHEHEIYAALAQDLPEKAVERTLGSKTGKGYDTTGYKYQYVVNRFNEVLGITNWWFTHEIVDTQNVQTSRGNSRIAVSVTTTITIRIGDREVSKTLSGGHNSNNHADALKGAITNSFKKTAALFGVGKAAYEVSIDDDNEPVSNNRPGEAPSKSGYTQQGRGYVTAKQAEAIAKMAGFLGIKQEEWKQKNGWESYYKIPFDQGSKIIDTLKGMIEKKKQKEAMDANAGPEEPTIQMDEEPIGPDVEIPGADEGMSDDEADALMADL